MTLAWDRVCRTGTERDGLFLQAPPEAEKHKGSTTLPGMLPRVSLANDPHHWYLGTMVASAVKRRLCWEWLTVFIVSRSAESFQGSASVSFYKPVTFSRSLLAASLLCVLLFCAMESKTYGRYLRQLLPALLLPLAAAAMFGAGPQENQHVIRFVSNPDPAPDFQLKSIDGKPLNLADARGKVVFLNFWATWCGPCRLEIPDLVDLQNRYSDRLQIIGLDVDDDDAAEIQKYVDENGINYPVAITPADLRTQFGGIPALPTSFVVDTAGRVVQKHVGLFNPQLYETEIRALLGMPIMARVETFEDRGEVFLKHADRATELPGVDLSKLTPEQKRVALHRMNAETCSCGCSFTLAQCRIWDTACSASKQATEKIVAEVSGAADPTATPANPGSAPQQPSAKPQAAQPSSTEKPAAPNPNSPNNR
jgi:thiol-disulfide isomerase/thioredoxin